MRRVLPGRVVRLAPLVLLVCLLTACVALPTSGPVVEASDAGRGQDRAAAFIEPVPPQDGDSPQDIVAGFLAAMRATPLQTTVAQAYLTEAAAGTWRPDQEIIIFANSDRPVGTSPVRVRLRGTSSIDSQGAWQGPVSTGDLTLEFPMAVEGGEWRIGSVRDALIVTDLWFDQRFRPVALYFFDPTGEVLVPEPVFVPRGQQFATALATRLLEGPAPEPNDVSRSFFPEGSRLEQLSVTVTEDGVAEVAVQSDAGSLSAEAAPLALAQLAWTLRQDPSIRQIRLTFNGEPVVLEGGETQPDVDAGVAYDPTGLGSSVELFGLRGGRVVEASPDDETPLTGPLSARTYRLRSMAVDLTATRVAGVSSDGRRVVLAPLDEAEGTVRTAYARATDVLPPSFDVAGRLWLVDRTPDGAAVLVVRGGRALPVEVPGVTGRRVRSFLVSRDGSRLAAVVAGANGDTVVVSRLSHGPQGRLLGATPAVAVGGGEEEERLRVRALQWRSPTHLVALTALSSERDELRLFSVDGSPVGAETFGWTRLLLATRGRQFASSPVLDSPMVVVTEEGALDPLNSGGRLEVDPALANLTYVG